MHTRLSIEAATAVLGTAHGVTVTESTFAPGVRIDPHTHTTGYLCVTLGGSVVDTLVQRRLDAEPGYSCWVPPETPHANLFGPRGARCLLLEISGRALDRWTEVGCAAPQPWGAYGGAAACRGFVLHGMLRAGVGTSLDIDAFVVTMLDRARRQAFNRAGQPPWVRRVREMLDAHLDDPPGLAALAGEAGVHPMHVLRVFRSHVACSPGQYVQTRRVAKACELLAETGMPLSFVALSVGYYDQSHFTRAFRARTGVTPGAFRALASSGRRPRGWSDDARTAEDGRHPARLTGRARRPRAGTFGAVSRRKVAEQARAIAIAVTTRGVTAT